MNSTQFPQGPYFGISFEIWWNKSSLEIFLSEKIWDSESFYYSDTSKSSMEKSDPGLRNSESLESCAIPNSTSINRSDEIEDLTVSIIEHQDIPMNKIYPFHTLYT